MAEKTPSEVAPDTTWIVPPSRSLDPVSMGISIDATARDLTPDFVKRLTAVVRQVKGIGDIAIGGDDGETMGRCKVLTSCNVNGDRCGLLQFCGTNA